MLVTDAGPRRSQRLRFRINMYTLREERDIRPQAFMNLLSSMLYERRFGPYFVEPVIAGLDPTTWTPFICSMDLLGCSQTPSDFVVAGTCTPQLYGMCESLWEPDMVRPALSSTGTRARRPHSMPHQTRLIALRRGPNSCLRQSAKP